MQELRTPHLAPTQPLHAHRHNSQPPHDSSSNTTSQDSVILHTAPKPPKLRKICFLYRCQHLHPALTLSFITYYQWPDYIFGVSLNLASHSSNPAADLNQAMQNSNFSPTPKSQTAQSGFMVSLAVPLHNQTISMSTPHVAKALGHTRVVVPLVQNVMSQRFSAEMQVGSNGAQLGQAQGNGWAHLPFKVYALVVRVRLHHPNVGWGAKAGQFNHGLCSFGSSFFLPLPLSLQA